MFAPSSIPETVSGTEVANTSTFTGNTSDEPEQSLELDQQRAEVKRWCDRILRAKVHWEKDFKRMREDMEFASGLQWDGQTSLLEERYINNVTLRNPLCEEPNSSRNA
jgi:hypothetical protein